MKRLFIFITCIFGVLLMTACTSKGTSLRKVLDSLTLGENNQEVTEDFSVPKKIVFEGKTYDIMWTTNSPYLTIEKGQSNVFIKIDFESVEEEHTRVLLVATIANETEEASKIFSFYITGKKEEGDGNITATKTTFTNRLDTDGPLTEEAFPSIGKPKMLVIPVNLNSSLATAKNLQEIKTAFTGTALETGWESVKSYYYKSSYGKLDMQIDVLDEWFTPSKSASYYNNYYTDEEDGSQLILREALKYYDSRFNYSDYDYDKDGFIDGVWLIYNYAVDYYDENSLFWAFTSWDYDFPEFDGVSAYYYAWAGIDFMHQTVDEAGYYDPTDISIDAHTYIHETGHLMGLDDYYDYDEDTGANSYGFYGCDMMDFNIGDHSPISKLLLGWVSPTVVRGTGEITLDLASFTTTGEFIIIADHKLTSIYDSYWTIEFYTNDGLNQHDKPYDSSTIDYGIRVMKINAEKNIVKGEVELNSGLYQTGFKYDNSDEKLMFADGVYEVTPDLFNDFSLDADCLFQINESLKEEDLPFEFVVEAMDNTTARIKIIMK